MDELAPVRAAYAAIAPSYLERYGRDLLALDLDRSLVESVAATAGRHPVLDLGCGPAHAAWLLADLGCRVLGVDMTPAMLRAAQPRPEVLLVAGRLEALPVRAGSAGGAVLYYVLHHVGRSALPGFLAGIRTVLAPGARLALATHEGDGDWEPAPGLLCTLHREHELVVALGSAGFVVAGVHRRDPLPHERQGDRVYVEAVAT